MLTCDLHDETHAACVQARAKGLPMCLGHWGLVPALVRNAFYEARRRLVDEPSEGNVNAWTAAMKVAGEAAVKHTLFRKICNRTIPMHGRGNNA